MTIQGELTTFIHTNLADQYRVRFEMDDIPLTDNHDFPVARVTTPPGHIVPVKDGTHVLCVTGREYSAASVFAGDCHDANVEWLLTISAHFMAISGWEREPGDGLYIGPCPKCWKKNDVAKPYADVPITCKHCGTPLVVHSVLK